MDLPAWILLRCLITILFIEISLFVMEQFHKMFQGFNFSWYHNDFSQNVSEIQFVTKLQCFRDTIVSQNQNVAETQFFTISKCFRDTMRNLTSGCWSPQWAPGGARWNNSSASASYQHQHHNYLRFNIIWSLYCHLCNILWMTHNLTSSPSLHSSLCSVHWHHHQSEGWRLRPQLPSAGALSLRRQNHWMSCQL